MGKKKQGDDPWLAKAIGRGVGNLVSYTLFGTVSKPEEEKSPREKRLDAVARYACCSGCLLLLLLCVVLYLVLMFAG